MLGWQRVGTEGASLCQLRVEMCYRENHCLEPGELWQAGPRALSRSKDTAARCSWGIEIPLRQFPTERRATRLSRQQLPTYGAPWGKPIFDPDF
jgi:hypothetical protein